MNLKDTNEAIRDYDRKRKVEQRNEAIAAVDNFFPFEGGAAYKNKRSEGEKELNHEMKMHIDAENKRITKAQVERQKNSNKVNETRAKKSGLSSIGLQSDLVSYDNNKVKNCMQHALKRYEEELS